jgi:hypothetical protein
MNSGNTEAYREQLRLMAAGRGDGIDLDSPERWVVENLLDPAAFFRNLELLIPGDSILYLECENLPAEVAKFYEAHRASSGAVCVTRDMIFPVPDIFHVQMQSGVAECIIGLVRRHSQILCFRHLKAYREEKMLFAFHDAFDGSDLLVSDQVPEPRVQAFSTALGTTCRREHNVNKRNPEVLRRILWQMENPHKVRMFWPWWKKALFFWKK